MDFAMFSVWVGQFVAAIFAPLIALVSVISSLFGLNPE